MAKSVRCELAIAGVFAGVILLYMLLEERSRHITVKVPVL